MESVIRPHSRVIVPATELSSMTKDECAVSTRVAKLGPAHPGKSLGDPRSEIRQVLWMVLGPAEDLFEPRLDRLCWRHAAGLCTGTSGPDGMINRRSGCLSELRE